MNLSTSARRSHASTEPSTLIAFYEESGTDARGRCLSDILRWNEHKLESSHDYIQTLFPLPERSGVNDRAPIIDWQVFDAFRAREDLRDKLRDAFRKMLWFYGFQLEENGEGGQFVVSESGCGETSSNAILARQMCSTVLVPSSVNVSFSDIVSLICLQVKKGHNYPAHSQNWLARFDHNHLRITRIIRCLRVLGLEEEALAFYDVIATASVVSPRSRMYWERAAHRPLNIRPDVEEEVVDEVRMGPKFLREFEQARKDRARTAPGAETAEDDPTITKSESHTENGEAEES